MDAKTLKDCLPSYGPDWDAAVELGIDVSLLEETLQMTVEERLVALEGLNRVAEELLAAGQHSVPKHR